MEKLLMSVVRLAVTIAARRAPSGRAGRHSPVTVRVGIRCMC
jgi:hypothetical protein